jgi:membrane-associated phospholipid phosphatase
MKKNRIQIAENKSFAAITEIFHSLMELLRNKYLYYGLLTLAAGAALNLASQTYLHNYMSEGKTLPMLSDLILDNIPYMEVSLIYDLFCLFPIFLVMIYTIHKKEYDRLPFFFVLSGIFYIIRGAFIVLTPFGNPPMFTGSDALFNGFSKYELGVYPSGHTGNVFLMYLLVKDKFYKKLILACAVIVIAALFLSRGHYSIDILSGLVFSYAIRSYGEKHLMKFAGGSVKKHKEVTLLGHPVVLRSQKEKHREIV